MFSVWEIRHSQKFAFRKTFLVLFTITGSPAVIGEHVIMLTTQMLDYSHSRMRVWSLSL